MELSDIWDVKFNKTAADKPCGLCGGRLHERPGLSESGMSLGYIPKDALEHYSVQDKEKLQDRLESIKDVVKNDGTTLTFNEKGLPNEVGLCWSCAGDYDDADKQDAREQADAETEARAEAQSIEDAFGDSSDAEYMRTPYDRAQHSDWVN